MKKRTISLLSLALLGAMVIPGAAFAEEGSVLNVEVWNEEFKSRITDHYPGYEEVDATTGKIGDALLLFNSDEVAPDAAAEGVQKGLPITRMAKELGNPQTANILTMGIIAGLTKVITPDGAKEAIRNEKAEFSYMLHLADDDIDNVNGQTAFDAQQAGDNTGAEVVNQYIGYLATGLINIINIFQPDVLCIGGGIAGQGENLLGPLRTIIEQERFTKYNDKQTKVCIATLGNDAGIIGAACL